jgi:hypothetical protein
MQYHGKDLQPVLYIEHSNFLCNSAWLLPRKHGIKALHVALEDGTTKWLAVSGEVVRLKAWR